MVHKVNNYILVIEKIMEMKIYFLTFDDISTFNTKQKS